MCTDSLISSDIGVFKDEYLVGKDPTGDKETKNNNVNDNVDKVIITFLLSCHYHSLKLYAVFNSQLDCRCPMSNSREFFLQDEECLWSVLNVNLCSQSLEKFI